MSNFSSAFMRITYAIQSKIIVIKKVMTLFNKTGTPIITIMAPKYDGCLTIEYGPDLISICSFVERAVAVKYLPKVKMEYKRRARPAQINAIPERVNKILDCCEFLK